MKKTILFILIFLIKTNLAYSIQEIKIVTHSALPPYAYIDSQGNPTGIYIEIVKSVVLQMSEYSLSFDILPWARAKAMVKSGKAFAILPPYYHAHDWLTDTEPKRPYIWPYSEPLFTQNDVVICNEEVLTSRSLVNYPDDLRGLKVVMQRGDGRAGVKFLQMVEDKEINLLLVNDTIESIRFLLSEFADCIIISRATFAWYVKQMKESGDFQKFNNRGIVFKEAMSISSNHGYLGYCDIDDEINYPYKDDFSNKFDIEFNKLKENGEIQKIIDRFVY
ncbi:MAG: transporter substrate-binding domain-containing protein [bacterium]|nr:transporter substrate-binding domain-containing protein [bacterium]